MRLAITGHRPPKLGGYYQPNRVSTAVREALFHWFQGVRSELEMVYIGMALGADQWAAELCIQLGIPFFACIPFLGYESKWPPSSQTHYRELVSHSYDQIVVTPRHEYRAWFLQARNQWMVDHADRVLAVFNGVRAGGTWNCLRYAEQVGKQWNSIILPDEIWAEARQIELELEAQTRDRMSSAYGGFTAQDRANLLALQAATDQPLADPTTATVVDPQPTGVVPHPGGAPTLIRRRRRGPIIPAPLEVATRPIVAPPRDDLFQELDRYQRDALAQAMGVPEAFLRERAAPPTQEQTDKPQEVRDRFKPGRTLELDDD